MTEQDTDPLLSAAQAGELCGIQGTTWRGYVRAGYAPPPDEPDADAPPNRRNPRWRRSAVEHFKANRLGQGKRTDIPRKKAETVEELRKSIPGIERAVFPGREPRP